MTLENWVVFWKITTPILAVLITSFGIWRVTVNEAKIKERDKSTISPTDQYKDFDNVILDAKVDSVGGDGILVQGMNGKTLIKNPSVSKAKGAGIKISDKKADKKNK